MRTSEAGRRFIEGHEGRRLHVYDDGAGNPTIGIGHKLRNWHDCPGGITDEECDRLFMEDLVVGEGSIGLLTRNLTLQQQQFDALSDFIFNVGPTHFKNSQVATELHKGNLDQIPIHFFYWTKAGGRRLKALLARRHACARLYWFGDYRPGY